MGKSDFRGKSDWGEKDRLGQKLAVAGLLKKSVWDK
jgi:hypothetical protein